MEIKMAEKLTKQDVKKRFEEKGLKVLNLNSYERNTTKLTSIDKDGYLYYFSLINLWKFSYNIKAKVTKGNPYSFKNVLTFLKLNNINQTPLEIDFDYSKKHHTSWHGSYLKFKCKCGNYYYIPWSRVINSQNIIFCCDRCKKKIPSVKKYTFEFVKETLLKHGYRLLDNFYKGNSENLTCLNNDGYRVKVKFTNIINNSKKKPYIFSPVFNLENYLYNINNYFKLNDINCKAISYDLESEKYGDEIVPITCICECGNKFITSISSIKIGQYRCQKCTKYGSIIENKVKRWLDSKHIEYIPQYKFKDCKDIRPLPFDFYLPKYNCCIEVDGEQHYKLVPFGSEGKEELKEKLKQRQYHDKIKTEYCQNNNIKLIRIPQNKIERRHEEYKKILYENLIKK